MAGQSTSGSCMAWCWSCAVNVRLPGTVTPTITSSPEVTVGNEPRIWMALDHTNLQQGDMDKATETCERLIRDSYMAKRNSSSVDLMHHVTDPNRVITRVDVPNVKGEYHDIYLSLSCHLSPRAPWYFPRRQPSEPRCDHCHVPLTGTLQ